MFDDSTDKKETKQNLSEITEYSTSDWGKKTDLKSFIYKNAKKYRRCVRPLLSEYIENVWRLMQNYGVAHPPPSSLAPFPPIRKMWDVDSSMKFGL